VSFIKSIFYPGIVYEIKFVNMDRPTWLKEKRQLSEERMDHLFAPTYDENWGASIYPLHHRFVSQLIEACPPHGDILDAACGTGKYWQTILASGRTLTGIDQSQGMLACAKTKFPQVSVEKIGLQEMPYRDAFDGIICVDAMENIFPEDWLLVLNNFHQALKSPGHLYFTVEIADGQDLDRVYQAGIQKGLPVVYGEWADEEGYHYYPSMEKVHKWIGMAGFVIVEEAEEDEYHHFLVAKE
jgi:SAM-dependent methyltransferase